MARTRKSPAEQKAAEPQPQNLPQEQQAQALQEQVPAPVLKNQTGADAPAMAAAPMAPSEPEPEPEPLEAFLRRVERLHIRRDVVATAATHPHATQRVWPGTYGGIRLEVGPLSVTYSDGSTA